MFVLIMARYALTNKNAKETIPSRSAHIDTTAWSLPLILTIIVVEPTTKMARHSHFGDGSVGAARHDCLWCPCCFLNLHQREPQHFAAWRSPAWLKTTQSEALDVEIPALTTLPGKDGLTMRGREEHRGRRGAIVKLQRISPRAEATETATNL